MANAMARTYASTPNQSAYAKTDNTETYERAAQKYAQTERNSRSFRTFVSPSNTKTDSRKSTVMKETAQPKPNERIAKATEQT